MLVCIYRMVQYFTRFAKSHEWRHLWEDYFVGREGVNMGPLAATADAMKTLRVSWISPYKLKANDKTFDLPGGAATDTGGRQKFLHDLREALRAGAWAYEARRRPKDFAGSERGLCMQAHRRTEHEIPCVRTFAVHGRHVDGSEVALREAE